MKIVEQSFEILSPLGEDGLVNECKKIEKIGRTCYKSEDKITENSWRGFISMLQEKQHGAMLEHGNMSIKVTTDRGVLAEWTRHRLFSYAVESTRYCNYGKEKFGKEITVISPFIEKNDDTAYKAWLLACEEAENNYFNILNQNYSPQIARSVLPLSLKCDMCVTGNFREWLHFFHLRCAKDAHPSIRFIALKILEGTFFKYIPRILDDELTKLFLKDSN